MLYGKRLLPTLITLTIVASPIVGQEKQQKVTAKDQPTAKVRLLSIIRPLPPEEEGLGGWAPNTTIGVVLRTPGKQIIGCDSAKSKIHYMTDSAGTNLLDGKRGQFTGINAHAVTDLGKSLGMVYLVGNLSPAHGATFIRLKADIAVRIGKDEKKSAPQKIKLALGQQSNGAVSASTVDDNGRVLLRVEWTDPGQLIRFEKGELSPIGRSMSIKHVEIVDQRGKSLSVGWGSNAEPFPNAPPRWIEHRVVTPEMTEATIVATFYEAVETLIVPVELRVGLGGEIERADK